MTQPQDPIAFWNGPAAERWVREGDLFDRALAFHRDLLLEALPLAPGARVLDVGPGGGATTLAIAARVAPGGVAVGLDVSAPLLARARRRAEGVANVTFVQGDATTHPLEPASFDLVCSRFGVMFFTDPVRAFKNLRGALRPSGRLVFVCWRSLDENPWSRGSFDALGGLVAEPPQAPPDAPGPFSLADPARTRHILEAAGFAHVEVAPRDVDLVFSETGDRNEALAVTQVFGLVGRALDDADEGARERAREPLLRWVDRYAGPRGVRVPSAAWLVTARPI